MVKLKVCAPPKIKLKFSNNVLLGSEKAYEKYEGEYEIIPRLTSQEIGTKDRVMVENLKIKEIPIEAVSNNAGGKTIIIG